MDRKEFLRLIAMAGITVAMPCAIGCSKTEGGTAPANVDITLDLTNSTYSSLLNSGGYYQHPDGVLIFNSLGSYYAVQLVCPHESGRLYLNGSKINCDKHSTQSFTTSGISEGRETNINLTTYNAVRTGTNLKITSK